MNKSEWASWVQAFGVIGALFMPALVGLYRKRKQREIFYDLGHYLKNTIEKLWLVSSIVELGDKDDAVAVYEEMLLRFSYFKSPLPVQIEAITAVDTVIAIRLLNAIDAIHGRREVVAAMRKREDIYAADDFYNHLILQSDKLREEVSRLEYIGHWIETVRVNSNWFRKILPRRFRLH